MKKCIKCGESKSPRSFHKRTKSKDGRQPWCKNCDRLNRNKVYHQKPDVHHRYVAQRRDMTRLRMLRYLADHPCACGEANPAALDFVYKSGGYYSINMAIRHGHSWATIMKEASQCVVLCANCQRKTMARTKGWHQRMGIAMASLTDDKRLKTATG